MRYVCEREIVKRQVIKIEWRPTIEEIRDPKTRRLFIAGRRRMDVHLLAYVYISPFYVGKTFMSPDYSQAGNWSPRPRIARVFLIDYFKGVPSRPKEVDARCYRDKTSISRFQRVLLLVSLVLRWEHCAVCHNINGRESNKSKRSKINATAYFARNNNFEIYLNLKIQSS